MSLAAACLVWLSEMHGAAEALTLDRDYRIYRRHGNKVIPGGCRSKTMSRQPVLLDLDQFLAQGSGCLFSWRHRRQS